MTAIELFTKTRKYLIESCHRPGILGDKFMEGQEVKKQFKQGMKFDNEKPRMDLLSTEALVQIANVLTFGANKYGDHNWREGLLWSRVIAAAMRHLTAFNAGEDKDEETGLSHLAHLGCCVMFLLDYEKNKKEFDDRYKGVELE